MTLDDFSSGFSVLLNSYSRESLFGEEATRETIVLDEFEKSLLLTEAQREIVLELYTGKNPYGESFEYTEEIRRYLSDLISQATKTPITNLTGMPLGGEGLASFFTLPDDLWFITYESVKLSDDINGCKAGAVLDVVPVKQDEYHKVKRNPFRGATSRRALRLDLSDNNVEIICKYPIASYYVRYLKKLTPIVLADLGDVDIEGVSTPTECELHEALHQKILERAVLKALESRGRINNTRRE
jgi:hypothetical protein